MLELVWKHTQQAKSAVLSVDQFGGLCFELFSAFWGNDLEDGYWSSLDEQQRLEVGVMLIDNEADALTLASASRLLNNIYHVAAPFLVAHIDKIADSMGLFTIETAERVLVHLGQSEYDPAILLQQVKETHRYFSWGRFLQNLRKKYQLQGATLEDIGFSRAMHF